MKKNIAQKKIHNVVEKHKSIDNRGQNINDMQEMVENSIYAFRVPKEEERDYRTKEIHEEMTENFT